MMRVDTTLYLRRCQPLLRKSATPRCIEGHLGGAQTACLGLPRLHLKSKQREEFHIECLRPATVDQGGDPYGHSPGTTDEIHDLRHAATGSDHVFHDEHA